MFLHFNAMTTKALEPDRRLLSQTADHGARQADDEVCEGARDGVHLYYHMTMTDGEPDDDEGAEAY